MTPTLTTQQLQTLKAHLAANANTVSIGGGPQTAISAVPHTPDVAVEVARWYNLAFSPDYFVWRSDAPVSEILSGLNYSNFTPNDDPNQATAVTAQVWENRAMLVQIKQINLQMMLQGQDRLDATLSNLRVGLQDACEFLPTGNNGNNRAGGWANVLPKLSRKAKNAEKLFATGTGTQADAGLLTASGDLTASEVDAAWNLPG